MLDIKKIEIECENAIRWIRDYIKNNNAKGAVVGISGGKDSAVVLAMLVKALGNDKVLGVTMPCSTSNSDNTDYIEYFNSDLADAKLLSELFGVKLVTVDISKCYIELEKEINMQVCELVDESKINIKPRLRMTTLYAIAQSIRLFGLRYR